MPNSIDNREALLRRGRDFLHARKAYVSDPDCLPSMIMACIEEGCNTWENIIRTVPTFVGHSYRAVARTVDLLTGPSPDSHYWFRDETRTYHLHLPPAKPKRGKRKQARELANG
jgi:hypothetical protein